MVDRQFTDEELLRHLEGELGAADSAELEAAMAQDTALRSRYEQRVRFLDALRSAPPQLDDIDVRAAVHRHREEPTRRHFAWVGVAALAAAVAVVAVTTRDTDEYGVRGPGEATTADKWSGIRVFEVDSMGQSQPVESSIRRGASLAFAYTNIGPKPFLHLMIVAVDAHGECFWYHPSFTEADTNPTSLTIDVGKSDAPLPEQIRHRGLAGPIEVHGLFSRKPLTVMDVEQYFAKPQKTRAGLMDDVVDHRIALTVTP